MTLIEITIALAIVGLLISLAIVSMNALTHASLRSSAITLSGAIKMTYDRSIMEKRTERIGMDLDQQVWWLEYTEDPYAFSQEKQKGKEGDKRQDPEEALLADDAKKKEDKFFDSHEDEEVKLALEGGQGSRFKPDLDVESGKPTPLSGGIRFSKVWTGHQDEPFTSGVAYLHFFRSGFSEPAEIEITDGDEFVTLKVHPLTGRVTSKDQPIDAHKLEKDDDTNNRELEGDE